jgi:hypothetical protein
MLSSHAAEHIRHSLESLVVRAHQPCGMPTVPAVDGRDNQIAARSAPYQQDCCINRNQDQRRVSWLVQH